MLVEVQRLTLTVSCLQATPKNRDQSLHRRILFQNILKRTAPGSRDEDTATKAFNELKKVVIIRDRQLQELL